MDRSILSLILLLIFSMINSKLIPTNDLKLALSEAEPGDIIELKSGIYRDAPYSLKSGSQGKPIIIRSATYADMQILYFQVIKILVYLMVKELHIYP